MPLQENRKPGLDLVLNVQLSRFFNFPIQEENRKKGMPPEFH